MRYLAPPVADLLAAEYVLGTLKGPARRRFERLMIAHPSLRSRVGAWELRLNRLAASSKPVPPPPATWTALQQRLFPPSQRLRWFERLNLWRGFSLAASATAGVLALLLWWLPAIQSPAYMVLIGDKSSPQPMWVAGASPDMGRFYVKSIKPMDIPANKRCLLWLHPAGSQNYYVLGLLPDKGDDSMLEIGGDMRPMLPGKLLVTVEDMAKPMPKRPTGPPLYEGKWMPLKI